MAASMTPLGFAKLYYELWTYLFPQEVSGPKAGYVPPTGWRPLRADNYRLGSSAWRENFWYNDIAPRFRNGGSVTVCVNTINDTTEEVEFRNPMPLQRHFNAPFVGKGSPEQVQIAVQLVYRFRKVSTSLEDFLARDFVGLDCNGFVGNYYQKVVLGKDWKFADVNEDPGPTTLMDGLHALGEDVLDLKDLRADGTYVLVWCDEGGNIKNPQKGVPNSYGHVMITEPNTLTGTPGFQRVHVVEATASGDRKLRDLDYTLKSSKPVTVRGRKTGVFLVERGSAGDPMYVRMSRLKV